MGRNLIIFCMPLAKRRGSLKNGNPPGDLSKSKKCGAKSKRTGNPCRAPAMKNGRCRMHGGKSTGPKTAEGRNKIAAVHTKHGNYEKEYIEMRMRFRNAKREARKIFKKLNRI